MVFSIIAGYYIGKRIDNASIKNERKLWLTFGPIVRYSDIEFQIHNRVENINDFTTGIMRFSIGLSKKVLLANYFSVIADNIFSITTGRPTFTAWIGALAYTLQIFFDFSGYSDMAIGLGKNVWFPFS